MIICKIVKERYLIFKTFHLRWKRRFGNRVEESSSDPVQVQDDLIALPKVKEQITVALSKMCHEGCFFTHTSKQHARDAFMSEKGPLTSLVWRYT